MLKRKSTMQASRQRIRFVFVNTATIRLRFTIQDFLSYYYYTYTQRERSHRAKIDNKVQNTQRHGNNVRLNFFRHRLYNQAFFFCFLSSAFSACSLFLLPALPITINSMANRRDVNYAMRPLFNAKKRNFSHYWIISCDWIKIIDYNYTF